MYSLFKRLLDILFSLAGLLFLLPIFLLIIIVLLFTGEKEVLYNQQRVGYLGIKFNLIKFNTMLKNSPSMGTGYITIRNDPRVTPAGKWLRITKINELPQLWNVLKGDMSFVGPRPLPEQSFAKYSSDVQSKLYIVRPGITGLGSLVFRDEEKLVTTVRDMGFDPLDYYAKYIYPYKGALEMWYQENISFSVDLKILLLTFWQILFPGSDWTFKVLRGLPKRPDELTIQGLKE